MTAKGNKCTFICINILDFYLFLFLLIKNNMFPLGTNHKLLGQLRGKGRISPTGVHLVY